MWQIQESLLQHYRTMAATTLGLVCTSILVFTSKYYSEFDKNNFNFTNDKFFINGLGLILLGSLHVLAVWGCYSFQQVCSHRAKVVTFFQNLLVAQENGTLNERLKAHGLPKNVAVVTLLRHMKSNNSTTGTMTRRDYAGFTKEFLDEARQLAHDRKRKSVRSFLQHYFFLMFYITFLFTAMLASIFIARYFMISVHFDIHFGR